MVSVVLNPYILQINSSILTKVYCSSSNINDICINFSVKYSDSLNTEQTLFPLLKNYWLLSHPANARKAGTAALTSCPKASCKCVTLINRWWFATPTYLGVGATICYILYQNLVDQRAKPFCISFFMSRARKGLLFCSYHFTFADNKFETSIRIQINCFIINGRWHVVLCSLDKKCNKRLFKITNIFQYDWNVFFSYLIRTIDTKVFFTYCDAEEVSSWSWWNSVFWRQNC